LAPNGRKVWANTYALKFWKIGKQIWILYLLYYQHDKYSFQNMPQIAKSLFREKQNAVHLTIANRFMLFSENEAKLSPGKSGSVQEEPFAHNEIFL